MLATNRLISTIIRTYPRYLAPVSHITTPTPHLLPQSQKFSTLLLNKSNHPAPVQLLKNAEITNIGNNITRTLTKFSLKKGTKKTVKAVLKRFYRLQWGGWIRTMAGRHKHLWRKTKKRKIRLQRHVLCNGQQSFLLDKMVCAYWRKPKYYVDDPYEPYHSREWYNKSYTKPKPYFPPEDKV